jgi:hypothetical protein
MEFLVVKQQACRLDDLVSSHKEDWWQTTYLTAAKDNP